MTRKTAPIVILKLDDLSQQNGEIVPNFVRVAELLEERQIKAGFGLICAVTWPGGDSLADSTPAYLEQIKAWHHSGLFEIWFHGWDHAAHQVDGELYSEFNGRSFEAQKARFDRAQAMAQAKLGFVFTTFGAGGTKSKYPHWNEDTRKVVAEDPHINVWFYGKPADQAAQNLTKTGAVTVLDTVPQVNLERSVGNPDFEWFRENYRKHPERPYFVLQGHPNCWEADDFAELIRILEFLQTEGAIFIKPSEFREKWAKLNR